PPPPANLRRVTRGLQRLCTSAAVLLTLVLAGCAGSSSTATPGGATGSGTNPAALWTIPKGLAGPAAVGDDEWVSIEAWRDPAWAPPAPASPTARYSATTRTPARRSGSARPRGDRGCAR